MAHAGEPLRLDRPMLRSRSRSSSSNANSIADICTVRGTYSTGAGARCEAYLWYYVLQHRYYRLLMPACPSHSPGRSASQPGATPPPLPQRQTAWLVFSSSAQRLPSGSGSLQLSCQLATQRGRRKNRGRRDWEVRKLVLVLNTCDGSPSGVPAQNSVLMARHWSTREPLFSSDPAPERAAKGHRGQPKGQTIDHATTTTHAHPYLLPSS